jgi:hypothetical protein
MGQRCIVKANHFFAELPDKDLHQYDVSLLGLSGGPCCEEILEEAVMA